MIFKGYLWIVFYNYFVIIFLGVMIFKNGKSWCFGNDSLLFMWV